MTVPGVLRSQTEDFYAVDETEEPGVQMNASPPRSPTISDFAAKWRPLFGRRRISPQNAVGAATTIAIIGVWFVLWLAWRDNTPSPVPVRALVPAIPQSPAVTGAVGDSKPKAPTAPSDAPAVAEKPPTASMATRLTIVILPFANLS